MNQARKYAHLISASVAPGEELASLRDLQRQTVAGVERRAKRDRECRNSVF